MDNFISIYIILGVGFITLEMLMIILISKLKTYIRDIIRQTLLDIDTCLKVEGNRNSKNISYMLSAIQNSLNKILEKKSNNGNP